MRVSGALHSFKPVLPFIYQKFEELISKATLKSISLISGNNFWPEIMILSGFRSRCTIDLVSKYIAASRSWLVISRVTSSSRQPDGWSFTNYSRLTFPACSRTRKALPTSSSRYRSTILTIFGLSNLFKTYDSLIADSFMPGLCMLNTFTTSC